MFNGIEHTAIASPDAERLAAWYCGTLDFRIVLVSDSNYFLRARDGSLMEIIASSGPRASNRRTDPGIRHLAISVDDFDAACARLVEGGVRFLSEPATGPGSQIVFFEDLEGNILHLIRRQQPLPQ